MRFSPYGADAPLAPGARYSDCMRVLHTIVLGAVMLFVIAAHPQQTGPPAGLATANSAPPQKADPAIHRLILKDGSYQVVNKWEILHAPGGDRVRYISSERGGDWEEVPLSLIDWAATRAYEREHAGQGNAAAGDASGQDEAAAIDAEEKADRSRDIEVAPNLRLPVETGIWALDTYHDQPELVDLEQNTVNPRTGHNIVRSALNGEGATRQNIQINERHAKPALHESMPVFYVSIDEGTEREPGADALTVDTHGAGSLKDPEQGSSAHSRYVILHADVRKEFRFVGQVKINAFGTGPSVDNNVMLTNQELLPGKRWLKVTPKEPLSAGDYVLMEVLSPKEVNLGVWDFRVDPGAGDNENAILPLQRYKIEH